MDPYVNPVIAFSINQLDVRLGNIVNCIRRYGHHASCAIGLDMFVTWCQGIVTQGYGRMRDFVQGGLEYRTTMHRLHELESQLQELLKWKLLKVRQVWASELLDQDQEEDLEKAASGKVLMDVQGKNLKCSRCQDDIRCNSYLQQGSNGQGTAVLTSSCQPPPPPPPPPPLPPLSKNSVHFRIVKKSIAHTKDSLKENERRIGPLVTAEDLQRVKLRRPEERSLTHKGQMPLTDTTPYGGGELRRVVLRKTQSAVILRDVGNIIPIHADDVVKQKRILKKTTVKRSPGGTPIRDRKRRRESGHGLTPMMNKALRLKFEAQSPCLSSDSDSSSFSSPDNQPATAPVDL